MTRDEYEDWYRSRQERYTRFAYSLTGNYATAEEAFQSAMTFGPDELATLRPGPGLDAFMHTRIRWAAADARERDQRHMSAGGEGHDFSDLPDRESEATLWSDEVVEAIRTCIAGIDKHHLRVACVHWIIGEFGVSRENRADFSKLPPLCLAIVGGLVSGAEIAAWQTTPGITYATHEYRGRAQLRECLGEQGGWMEVVLDNAD